MTVALVANIARPISSAISTAFSADSYGLLSSYGLLGASSSPDAVIEALFDNSKVGAWYDPSDLSTMFQDSAGTTPVTADGQPVGLILDKSGRGNHASQATAANRPLYKTDGTYHWNIYDGVDDGVFTSTFLAGTFTSTMDCLMAVYRDNLDSDSLIMETVGAAAFVLMTPGSSSSATLGAGTPTMYVDGVAVPGGSAVTRGQLSDAVTTGAWHIVEMRNLDLSAWTALRLFSYNSNLFGGRDGGVILFESTSDEQRNAARTWLGNKVGVTL